MAALTVNEVRMFLRDYATSMDSGLTYIFNELLDHVEFNEEEVEFAMELTCHKFNAIGHRTTYDVTNFPNKYIHLIGTCSLLMSSNSFQQARNQLNYQDGGEHHGYSDKYEIYARLAEALKAEWNEIVPLFKASENLESSYDSLSSAYAYSGPYGYYGV